MSDFIPSIHSDKKMHLSRTLLSLLVTPVLELITPRLLTQNISTNTNLNTSQTLSPLHICAVEGKENCNNHPCLLLHQNTGKTKITIKSHLASPKLLGINGVVEILQGEGNKKATPNQSLHHAHCFDFKKAPKFLHFHPKINTDEIHLWKNTTNKTSSFHHMLY